MRFMVLLSIIDFFSVKSRSHQTQYIFSSLIKNGLFLLLNRQCYKMRGEKVFFFFKMLFSYHSYNFKLEFSGIYMVYLVISFLLLHIPYTNCATNLFCHKRSKISSLLFAHSAMKISVQTNYIQQVCYHNNFTC